MWWRNGREREAKQFKGCGERDQRGTAGCERPALPPDRATSGPVQPPSAASGSETLLQLTFVDVRPVLPPKAIQIPAVWTAA